MVYKVAIAVPNESFVPVEAYENHILIAHHLGRLEERLKHENSPVQYEFYRYTTGRILTPMARERLIGAGIEMGADFVLMMDNDMIYPVDFADKMLQDMIEHAEIDLLAPLAFTRGDPHNAVIYKVTEGYDSERHTTYYRNEWYKEYPRDTLVECDAVGFGAALIRLSSLDRLKMKAPYFFSTTNTGEDIWFCYQLRKAGGRIFMDTRIKLGHMGKNIIIDEEYKDNYDKSKKVREVEKPHPYLDKSRD